MKSVELIANRLGSRPWTARATVRKGDGTPPTHIYETAPTFRDLAEQLDKKLAELSVNEKRRTA
jgi:hypothetical protein